MGGLYSYVPGLIDFHIIGFCGQIYPVIEMRPSDMSAEHPKRVYCYTMEDLDTYLRATLKEKELDVYEGRSKRTRWGWHSISHKRDFERFFERFGKISGDYKEMFIEKRSPVFAARESGRWGGTRITWNALLRPFDFMRIFDPYTAFQEIQMFMNNLAAPEKEMPIIPDELKIQKRGFTDQSFRASFSDPSRVPK